MSKPLSSLSIFFPFYNDAGTVEKAITDAYEVGNTLTNKLEVIAIHGGSSKDDTWELIRQQGKKHPDLKIIDKRANIEGYAVIKHGFSTASNEWIFYTDGDLQYTLSDLPKLVEKQKSTGADVVNGYKVARGDSALRTLLGKMYQRLSRIVFQLPIRDTDCDFRLIRRSFLKNIRLKSKNASILPELIKKLQHSGATFAEVPVSHFKRSYGTSNYTPLGLFVEKLTGDIKVWWEIHH